MKYFFLVQDGVTDDDVAWFGPYNSTKQAQDNAEAEFEVEAGRIITVLAQDEKTFKMEQVSQVVFPETEGTKFPWKP